MSACAPLERLRQLVADELAAGEAAMLESHIEECASCREALARLVDTPSLGRWPGAEDDPHAGPGAGAEDSAAAFLQQLAEQPPANLGLADNPGSADTPRSIPAGANAGAVPATWPTVPGYAIEGVLGRGGMGVVYQARHVALNRRVALKMILAGAHADAEQQRRFHIEAEAIAQLRHGNFVQVFDYGVQDGQAYLVLELIEGGTLAQKAAGVPQLPERAAQLVETLAAAMHHAHQRGLVHRDLKPANVLLTADGVPKITDFGLAKRLETGSAPTASGTLLGTPTYMAPEQATGSQSAVGPATDVYALGVILYELLTGQPPFQGTGALELLQRIQREEPRPPSRLQPAVPRDLETICLRCLHKEPGRRYATAAALADDLRRFRAGEPIAARPSGVLERTGRWCRRNPGLAGALGAATVFLLLGTLVSSLLAAHALGEARRADREARLARDNETLAQDEKRWSQRRYYASEMKLASLEADAGQMGLVRQRLQEHEPSGAGTPDLRGFEWYYLQRLCQQDLRTLHGHTNMVMGVAYSPDGCRLASASWDQSVKVWDAATGRELLTLKGHTNAVNVVAYSPDGRRLASGSNDRSVKLWDAATGQELRTLNGHADGVWGLAFSPDGRHLASAGRDRVLKMWDAVTGQELRTLKGHVNAVMEVAFSPDGRRLASASEDRSVRVWDAATGQELLTIAGHLRMVNAVAYSPDGHRLASGSTDQTVKLWDAATGQELRTLYGHTSDVFAVAFSPDGRRLASAGADQTVKVWDTATGQALLTLKGHGAQVDRLAFSPDGRCLASASKDQTVKVWDAGIGQESQSLGGQLGIVAGVAFSPDGRHLASANYNQGARVWDAATGQELRTFKGNGDMVIAVAYSANGRCLACANWDQGVRVWDTATGQELRTLKGSTGRVVAVACSPDGRHLASADNDQAVKVRDTATGQELLSVNGHTGQVTRLAYSADGRRLASASRDQSIKVWDAATGQELLTLKGHTNAVLGVAYSPDGHRLASAGGDQTVKVWDAATGQELLTLKGHTSWVTGVVYSPDGRRVASSSWDQSVKVWDAATGQELLTLKGHAGPVTGVVYSADGRRLASSSHDQTVKVWDATELTPQQRIEREARGVWRFLFARLLLADEVAAAVCWDPTIAEAVRQEALKLAEIPLETPNALMLNNASWAVVCRPSADSAAYQRALRQAEAACRLAPNDTNLLNTLGVARYRAGMYREAVAALEKSLAGNAAPGVDASDLYFLAMCHHQLGQPTQARECFGRATDAHQRPAAPWTGEQGQELERFRAEAEAALGRGQSQPGR